MQDFDEGYDDDSNSSYDSYDSDSGSYSFEWDVDNSGSYEYGESSENSGSNENYYGHKESRSGDYTEGEYYVKLPDGRIMTVTYYVDGYSGFVPEISFDGSEEYESESEEDSDENYSR